MYPFATLLLFANIAFLPKLNIKVKKKINIREPHNIIKFQGEQLCRNSLTHKET